MVTVSTLPVLVHVIELAVPESQLFDCRQLAASHVSFPFGVTTVMLGVLLVVVLVVVLVGVLLVVSTPLEDELQKGVHQSSSEHPLNNGTVSNRQNVRRRFT